MNNNKFNKGFEIVDCENLKLLNNIKDSVYKYTKKTFNIKDIDPEKGFNNFHKSLKKISQTKLNSKRIELIKVLSSKLDLSSMLYEVFEESIKNLIGPDALAQKNTNLVIQMPGDENPSEVHRDAPANSPYEIVLWVPLVDCYKTKSMFIADIQSTEKSLKKLELNQDWKKFKQFVKNNSHNPSIKYGQALIFFSGLFHGSEINKEKETRFSLNTRYKNLFSPTGLKNQLQFFKPVRTTKLVKFGSKIEIKELLK